MTTIRSNEITNQMMSYIAESVGNEDSDEDEEKNESEEKEMTKIYEVFVDWAQDGDNGNWSELYSTKEKALKAFEKEVESAKSDYPEAFMESGELEEGWVEEQGTDLVSYELYQDDWYCSEHCEVRINEKILK